MQSFQKLQLTDWRQFEHVEIDFSKQTTILTGSNGCGKTTILNVLSHHFGWNVNFVSTSVFRQEEEKEVFLRYQKVDIGRYGSRSIDQSGCNYLHERNYFKFDKPSRAFE